jgi:hypothetical protein
MITNAYDETRALREEVKYLPAISIIQPFEPMMSLKSELEYRLKRAMEKVETELMANYTVHTAVPVIVKLQNLIHQLNYNTHKKSIAIFVSPLIEKVYYLDIRVEEKIVIDESFEIRDLVYSKKQNIQYLVLLLSAERSKMYLAIAQNLSLSNPMLLIIFMLTKMMQQKGLAIFQIPINAKKFY